jgi:glucan phosphorylase
MLNFITKEIIPAYVLHLKEPKNSLWTSKMTRARNLIFNNFSTTRMLKEYVEKLYLPILREKHSHKID